MDRLPTSFIPGDLVFFAGRDWLSRAIALRTCTWRQLFTGLWFSHVGICADWSGPQDSPERRGTRTLLFESTTLNDQPCFIAGEKICGVQAHIPQDRIKSYPGAVWRLRLRLPLTQSQSHNLSQFCEATIGQPYNTLRAAELATFFLRRLNESPLPDSWFCSDHALTALKCVDRVGQDWDPELISPGALAHIVLHSGAVWPIASVGSHSFLVK